MANFWCKLMISKQYESAAGACRTSGEDGTYIDFMMLVASSSESAQRWIRKNVNGLISIRDISEHPSADVDQIRFPGCTSIRIIDPDGQAEISPEPAPSIELELWSALKELVELEDIRLLGKRLSGSAKPWVLGYHDQHRDEVWKVARELVAKHRKAK